MPHPTRTTPPSADAAENAFLTDVSLYARRCARRYLVLGNLEDADDIAQDVVLECLIGLRNGDGSVFSSGIESYVRVLVLRRYIDLLRTAERRNLRDMEYERSRTDEEPLWMCPQRGEEFQALASALDEAICALPAARQRVYLMFQQEGTTYRTAARALGISPNTVREHLARARAELREALAEYRPPSRGEVAPQGDESQCDGTEAAA